MGFFNDNAKAFIFSVIHDINKESTDSEDNVYNSLEDEGIEIIVKNSIDKVVNCRTFFDMCKNIEEENLFDAKNERWSDFKTFCHGMYLAGRLNDTL